jgi:hypothetical protein
LKWHINRAVSDEEIDEFLSIIDQVITKIEDNIEQEIAKD